MTFGDGQGLFKAIGAVCQKEAEVLVKATPFLKRERALPLKGETQSYGRAMAAKRKSHDLGV